MSNAGKGQNGKLHALGHTGSSAFAGLEKIAVNPGSGLMNVEMVSDEVTAVCPVTGQPDQYHVSIMFPVQGFYLESKSLKLYLVGFRNEGIFAEELANVIAHDVSEVLSTQVTVRVKQKPRGGISLVATAAYPPISMTGGFPIPGMG